MSWLLVEYARLGNISRDLGPFTRCASATMDPLTSTSPPSLPVEDFVDLSGTSIGSCASPHVFNLVVLSYSCPQGVG